MKKIIDSILVLLLLLFSVTISAQNKKNKTSIAIKTSAVCGMCKATLEKTMAYERGVFSSNLNIETAILTVYYKPSKTTPEKIKNAVTDAGYSADGKEANQKSYENLPECCKKGGMDH
jgi:cation transport ATPase